MPELKMSVMESIQVPFVNLAYTLSICGACRCVGEGKYMFVVGYHDH